MKILCNKSIINTVYVNMDFAKETVGLRDFVNTEMEIRFLNKAILFTLEV